MTAVRSDAGMYVSARWIGRQTAFCLLHFTAFGLLPSAFCLAAG